MLPRRFNAFALKVTDYGAEKDDESSFLYVLKPEHLGCTRDEVLKKVLHRHPNRRRIHATVVAVCVTVEERSPEKGA